MSSYTIHISSIVSSFSGANPEHIKELVSDKTKELAQELPELKSV